jgi:hypothetical protein
VPRHQRNRDGLRRSSRAGRSPGLVRTRAQLADAGLLHGTTAAAFTITGLMGTGLSFAGPLTITTNRATVLVDLTGTLAS